MKPEGVAAALESADRLHGNVQAVEPPGGFAHIGVFKFFDADALLSAFVASPNNVGKGLAFKSAPVDLLVVVELDDYFKEFVVAPWANGFRTIGQAFIADQLPFFTFVEKAGRVEEETHCRRKAVSQDK